MKFGIVIFPGSNCDQDVIYALQNLMNQNVVSIRHKDSDIQNCDFIILPGGFSLDSNIYGSKMKKSMPIMEEIIRFSAKGGYVLGICNGFQILCDTGLLPGNLSQNKSHQFICKNTYIKAVTNNSIITSRLDINRPLSIPIAHAEGKYNLTNDIINEILDNDQILFKYCNAEGVVTEESNPNGSLLNIAGVCNKKRNVFGMMPHPERASDPDLKNTDGQLIFESIINSLM